MKKNILNNILKIIGGYGIVQVLAQDLGIKTGKRQRDLVQGEYVQIIILYSGAYITTGDHILSFITILIYYILKYYYSNGQVSEVCFENV